MPTDTAILFVNKTAASQKLSQSEGVERSRIFSHVQRASLNRISSSSPAGLSARALGSKSKPAESRRRAESSNPSDGRGRRSRPGSSKSDTTTGKRKAASAPTLLESNGQRQPSALIAQLSEIIDPFGGLNAPINPRAEQLLSNFIKNSRQMFPIKSLAVISRQATLSMAQKDPVLLSTLISTVSAAVYCVNGDEEHGYAAMFFKGHALQRLHMKLSESNSAPVEVSSVLAVALLIWIECLQGDIAGLWAHISGLQSLMTRAEDISTTPLPIMTTIMESAFLCAAYLQVAPTHRPAILCADRLSDQIRAVMDRHVEEHATGLGFLFFSPGTDEVMGLDLLEIIGNQREVMLWKQLFSLGKADPSPEEITYVYTKQMAVEYELLTMPFRAHDPPLRPSEQALRLALFTFTRPIILVARSSAAFPRAMALQIKSHLLLTDLANLWGTNSDVLLWILFVVAHVSLGQPEFDWCMVYIHQIVRALGLNTRDDLEQLLLGFYYFPEYFGETLQAIWTAVEVSQPLWQTGSPFYFSP